MAKKQKEHIECELRYSQGGVPDEMLTTLKECWPAAYKAYQDGNDIYLNLELEFAFDPEKPLSRLAPFFNLAKGYSLNSFASNGQLPPVYTLFGAINNIGKVRDKKS